MRKILIISAMIIVLLMSSCSQITKEQAEAKAIRFVKEKVKFYTKGNGSDLDFPSYDFSSVTTYKERNSWVVIIKVTTIKNESKKTDVVVELDARNGKITKFNNQPVSYQ